MFTALSFSSLSAKTVSALMRVAKITGVAGSVLGALQPVEDWLMSDSEYDDAYDDEYDEDEYEDDDEDL